MPLLVLPAIPMYPSDTSDTITMHLTLRWEGPRLAPGQLPRNCSDLIIWLTEILNVKSVLTAINEVAITRPVPGKTCERNFDFATYFSASNEE